MLILAGVSLNAIIGDNGIITNAQQANMKSSMAALEEFLQEKYVENYDSVADLNSKILGLINLYPGYFYVPANEGIGSLKYIVDSDGHALYLIKKSGLPDEIREQLVGGNAGTGTYSEYATLNDVYGVTSDLKVYYSPSTGADLVGIDLANLDKDNPLREVFGTSNTLTTALSSYDINGDGVITAEEAKSVIDLKIDSTSGVNSLEDIYNLTSLETLTLENVSLESLNGIQNCTNLYKIYLKNCTIRNYTAVGKLGSRLKYFYVYNLDDTELENICSKTVGIGSYDLPNLEYLAFTGHTSYINNFGIYWSNDYNTVYDIDTAKSTRKLTKIECLNNLSTNTKKAVHYLSIHCNNIVSLKGLEEFTELILLRADNNKITSLSNIANCSKIEELGVSYNNLTELANFKKGCALKTIGCQRNTTLTTLSGLENCSELYDVFAWNCNLGGRNTGETNLEIKANKQLTDSLTSLSGKSKLHKVFLQNNGNLLWVGYLSGNSAIRYFDVTGCLNIQDISNVKSIIQVCNLNAKVPSIYSLALLDTNTTFLDLNGRSLTETQFKSLKQYTKITKLGLQDVKILKDKEKETDPDEEITNNTSLNALFVEALSPMTSMMYLRLYGLKYLTTISFVNNMNSLKEIDLRGSGVTDLAILETKRNAGTMSLTCLGVNTTGTNLGLIPNTVSYASANRSASWIWVSNSRSGGIVCDNMTVWRTLNNSSISTLHIRLGIRIRYRKNRNFRFNRM